MTRQKMVLLVNTALPSIPKKRALTLPRREVAGSRPPYAARPTGTPFHNNPTELTVIILSSSIKTLTSGLFYYTKQKNVTLQSKQVMPKRSKLPIQKFCKSPQLEI